MEELEIIKAADIKCSPIEWLWYPFIPYGKVTVLQEDSGDGKSLMVLTLAAMLTRGLPMPFTDGDGQKPINVIYQSSEDDGLQDLLIVVIKDSRILEHIDRNVLPMGHPRRNASSQIWILLCHMVVELVLPLTEAFRPANDLFRGQSSIFRDRDKTKVHMADSNRISQSITAISVLLRCFRMMRPGSTSRINVCRPQDREQPGR